MAMPVRLFRERVVLTEMRRLRQASKTDIANGTRFALQTVIDIVNRLEEEGLVLKIGRRLGRVGQPSILYGINPDGVFGLGLSVRRSKCDLVVVDFEGRIRERLAFDHDMPHFEAVRTFLADGVAKIVRPDWRGRICGLGVALSHDLWYQPLRQGLPDEIVAPWRDRDVAAEFQTAIGLPVFVENDTRVAAVAEYLLGEGQDFDKFLHVVIGPHISGALVLGGSLETGAHGRAGTLGAIPVGPSRLAHACDDAGTNRLGTRASLAGLMRHLGLHGFTIRAVSELPEVLDQARGLVQEWLDDCVEALVEGLTACFAVIDVEAVIIDSELPQFLVMEIVEKLGRRMMATADAGHVVVPQLRLSRLGADGALIGGAILPINAHFFPTREAFAAEQSADVQPSRRGKKARNPKS
jgi:predicted NBD/HSP70 family sugar kinase